MNYLKFSHKKHLYHNTILEFSDVITNVKKNNTTACILKAKCMIQFHIAANATLHQYSHVFLRHVNKHFDISF